MAELSPDECLDLELWDHIFDDDDDDAADKSSPLKVLARDLRAQLEVRVHTHTHTAHGTGTPRLPCPKPTSTFAKEERRTAVTTPSSSLGAITFYHRVTCCCAAHLFLSSISRHCARAGSSSHPGSFIPFFSPRPS